MSFDEALVHAREMRFEGKSEFDLHQMLIAIGNRAGHTSDSYTLAQIPHARTMIQEELSRRQRAKNHQESISEQQKLHQQVTTQGNTLHGETMGELEKVKTAVEHLERARRVDWWILIVGAIAAIAGLSGVVISLIALKH